jgi:hypothetical protein
MDMKIYKHLDYLTPFEEAENDHELAEITTLKSSKACSNLEVDALFFARMVEGVKQHEAWRVLGLESFAGFCDVRLNKTILEVETIVAGVKALTALGAQTVTRAEAIRAAAAKTTGDVLPEGRPKKLGKLPSLSQAERAKQNGISPRTQKKLDRLARDSPDLHEKVKRGEMKPHRAAIEAGFVKEATPLTLLKREWAKASADEQQQFLRWLADNGGQKAA